MKTEKQVREALNSWLDGSPENDSIAIVRTLTYIRAYEWVLE